MDTGMQKIDVDRIMEEIRENIKRRGYPDEILKFSDVKYDGTGIEDSETYDEEKFVEYLRQANSGCAVSYYTPIPKKGIKNLVKCAIRKVMAFLILPINVQQNDFNIAVVKSLNCIKNYMGVTETDNSRISSNRMSAQEERKYFEYHEKQTDRLETKILLLEQEIEELRKRLESRDMQGEDS